MAYRVRHAAILLLCARCRRASDRGAAEPVKGEKRRRAEGYGRQKQDQLHRALPAAIAGSWARFVRVHRKLNCRIVFHRAARVGAGVVTDREDYILIELGMRGILRVPEGESRNPGFIASCLRRTPCIRVRFAPTSRIPRQLGSVLDPGCSLFTAVAIIVAITAMRAWIWWRNDAGISFASGVMITMAADLKAGVFYRPLLDSAGYGGTRYFPLYFCLHALLLKLGMPVLLSAYLLSAAAIIGLILGTFRLLKELGVEPWLAAGSALALLAAGSVQLSLSTPQADGLAAALNVWGLAVIARTPHEGRRIFLASLLFTLAWSAKLTTVFGLAVAFIWLIATGYKRVAWLLAGETFCGYLDGCRDNDRWQPRPCRGDIQSLRLWRRRLAVYRQRALADGVDGSLYRSRSGLVRRPRLVGAYRSDVFLEALAEPARVVPDSHAGDHDHDFRLPRNCGKSPARRAGRFGDSACHVGGEGSSPLQKQLGVYALALLTVIAAIPILRHIKTWSGGIIRINSIGYRSHRSDE